VGEIVSFGLMVIFMPEHMGAQILTSDMFNAFGDYVAMRKSYETETWNYHMGVMVSI
jgi:hypothetical protein